MDASKFAIRLVAGYDPPNWGNGFVRTLVFTAGSPFARAIRVILDELELDYRGEEPEVAPTAYQLSQPTPTMQVPTLRDGDLTLWDSGTIGEYLLARYPRRGAAEPPLAATAWRPDRLWQDKLVFSTIQTFGTAATTISQLTWTGVNTRDNAHLQRCAERMNHILAWLEDQICTDPAGFFPGCLSMQDIFLYCHVRFVQARPLGVDLDLAPDGKVTRLLERLDGRPSLQANPIWWWDPDVVAYQPDGTPVYRAT